MMKRFFIYGTMGWTMEIFWTGLFSLIKGNMLLPAFTYLWMFPIYGLAVFLEPIHDRIVSLPWYLRGLIWLLLIFSIEYSTGWILGSFLGTCPWDYSYSSPFHINGIIRLDYAPVWFIVGFLFEKMHHILDRIQI